MSADGGIPLWHRSYDGGAGEVAQVVPAMEALVELAGERSFLMVGDSKLVSYPNLAAMVKARVSFVAPASKSYVGTEVLAACDLDAAEPVAYIAERDIDEPVEDGGTYRVLEDTMVLHGKTKNDPHSSCAGSSCGPLPGPALPKRSGPRSSSGPVTTSNV